MAARFFARRTLKETSTSTPAQWEEPILKQTMEGHENSIWDFVFLHDNVHIVSGSEDGTMRKWNCNTGLIVGKPWKGNGGRIYSLALSPDGQIIACGRKDGSVQRWNTDGGMVAGIWTGHSGRVRSLSWSPSGDYLASGSNDGTILIRKAENGGVLEIKTSEQIRVWSLAYSPLGDRIASGGNKTICIWNTMTGKLVVGPIKGLGTWVTSVVWSADSTKLYSASDQFARVFDSKSGKLLQLLPFHHDNYLYSIALSPKHNVLACVGIDGIARLWDTEPLQPLSQPLSQDRQALFHVSFSPDGRYLAYGGGDNKLTLWSINDIAPQLAPILPQQSDRQSIQQETQPNSPSSSSSSSSSCLDMDATGVDVIIEEANDDPYSNNFFQSSHKSLPSASPGSRLPHLFSARRFFNVFSRPRPPADESVRKERSNRKFFARRAPSKSSLEMTTIKCNPPVPEGKVGDKKGEQGDNDRGSKSDPLGARKDTGKQQHGPPANAQSPSSHDSTPPADLDNQYNRNLWEWLIQARGHNTIFSSLDFSTRPTNAPQPIPRRPRQCNSNSFPVGSSRRPVNVAACREDERYATVPESDAEAAAGMLRTSGNEIGSPTRPGQPTVGAQVSHGQPTQPQASTSGPEEWVFEGVSCCGLTFLGYRRRSTLRQP